MNFAGYRVARADLEFTVHGDPQPQGSKRAFLAAGRPVVVDDNKVTLRTWRTDVVACATCAMLDAGWEEPLAGPVGVHLRFRLRRPKLTRRAWPSVRPDVDKLARACLDAMKAAGCYRDDGQVVRLVADKEYAERPGVTAAIYDYDRRS